MMFAAKALAIVSLYIIFAIAVAHGLQWLRRRRTKRC